MGGADLLRESRGDGRRRQGVGQRAADAEPLRHGMGLAHGAPARLCVGADCMAAGSLLRVLGGLWVDAHLSSRLVAVFLV